MSADGKSATSTAPSSSCAASGAGAARAISHADPVVFRVGYLGKGYEEWVNMPEPGQPRFFANALLDGATKTPWWVVPLLWLPLFTASLLEACVKLRLPPLAAAPLLAIGVVAWQLLEYCIHRFVFHAAVKSYWGITLHFLFHGCHHKYPMDRLRLVFPPLPASALVGAVYVLLTSCVSRAVALTLFAGMGYAYVAYDCIHYGVHNAARLPRFLRDLKQRHMQHHYKDHGRGYGISSTVFDVVFRTLHTRGAGGS